MIKKQSISKLDGLKALGRPGISRQLEPDSSPVVVSSTIVGRVPERSAQPLEALNTRVSGTGGSKRKRGRPRLGESHLTLAHTKPWSVAGMSQATWYRRQRELRK